MWYDKIIAKLNTPQIINDSKTPSGRVHVGSLRGVLIHDALYRALQDRSVPVTYIYGIDDYDPLDGLPADAKNLVKYMGFPLCNIPAPQDSKATDLADHYITEFLDVFKELGVNAQIYRMRDVYRSGKFDEAIDVILKKADIVRQVYANVSHSIRPDNWYPFQVVCEQCGKIGTTEVTDYDGKSVIYECRTDLVTWATGCGHKGKVSPFGGRGKMPWKLEWVAKWHSLGITIEGAGKDHCTKGGSRDVATHCLRAIFGKNAPLNVPYEFFLVKGAKMSSSKGIGTAAREMANFLPPEILRFLMIRTAPKKTVNFSTDYEYMIKLFNEHDRLLMAKYENTLSDSDKKMLKTLEVDADSPAYRPVNFQLITALLQLLHIDIEAEIERRMGALSDVERVHLRHRIQAAQYWLDHYASDADRFELQQELPACASEFSAAQKAFLNLLAEHIQSIDLQSEDEYQQLIFDVARLTPIDQRIAFVTLYRVLLNKDSGPRGGSLLSFLEKSFLIKRLNEVTFSQQDLWAETAISAEEFETWLSKHGKEVDTMTIENHIDSIIETRIVLTNGKIHVFRVRLTEVGQYIEKISKNYDFNIQNKIALN